MGVVCTPMTFDAADKPGAANGLQALEKVSTFFWLVVRSIRSTVSPNPKHDGVGPSPATEAKAGDRIRTDDIHVGNVTLYH